MHVTASTVRLRPVRIPALSPEATKAAVLAKWFAVTAEARARRILYMAAPTSEKIARRSCEGLGAAIAIIGTDPVQLAHVGGILRGMGSIPHLDNARLGHLDDEALWEDAQNALSIAQAAAKRRNTTGAVELLGRSLGVVEVLFSVPESERAAVVGRVLP